MTSSSPKTAIRPQVMEEAAGWLIECQAGEIQAAERAALDAWLRASPEHVRAYLELLPLWDSGTRIDAANVPDIETLIGWARGSDSNVVHLPPARIAPAEDISEMPDSAGTAPPRIGRPKLKWMLAAATLLFAIAGWHQLVRNTYRTGTGEQRSIALADGSLIELDAQSTVRIRYSDSHRRIELVQGQALFKVSHDANRPFVVDSGETRIRAVGTQFDVYRKKNGAIVTVIEGRVEVSKSGGERRTEAIAVTSPVPREAVPGDSALPGMAAQAPDAAPVLLVAGQQLAIDANPGSNAGPDNDPDSGPDNGPGPGPVEVDLARVTAWTERRLIFSATPLTDVVDEFNRYNERRLVLQGAGVHELRINGVFSSMDSVALLAFLKEQPGVTIVETPRQVRVTVQ